MSHPVLAKFMSEASLDLLTRVELCCASFRFPCSVECMYKIRGPVDFVKQWCFLLSRQNVCILVGLILTRRATCLCRSGATAERQLPGSAGVPGVPVCIGMAILTQSMAPVLLVVGCGPLPVQHSTLPPGESQPCAQP